MKRKKINTDIYKIGYTENIEKREKLNISKYIRKISLNIAFLGSLYMGAEYIHKKIIEIHPELFSKQYSKTDTTLPPTEEHKISQITEQQKDENKSK